MYLLDTNVISELRKHKPHGGVLGWLKSVGDDQIFLSAVTLGELQAALKAQRMAPRGPAGGMYSNAIFSHACGAATVFVPAPRTRRFMTRPAIPVQRPATYAATMDRVGIEWPSAIGRRSRLRRCV